MPKVLIADSDEPQRRKIASKLAVEGYAVVETDNGAKAVELFQSEKPDVVLLALTLPEKNGVSVLKEILAWQPSAKAIILAMPGQQAQILEAVKLGAKHYFIKPFDPEPLIGVIRKIMGIPF